jgi:hypothetical protein
MADKEEDVIKKFRPDRAVEDGSTLKIGVFASRLSSQKA